ncbi:Protein SRC2 [Camellia lanceoleosa]|uniref:Protein SRC2 n=1 Tax=Camellia lanceoleosa TaxID=1840588 RepID=A0ACC0G578_9ERIC|nr:Protein SRC2 [Camellia lanceoleosa]
MVYALVSISGGGKKWTAVDTLDHTNPTWNIPISFKVEEKTATNQILVVELRCYDPTGGGGDKDIGEVLVQVKDLMGSVENNSLTYQIQTPSENPKAKLTFMYKSAYEKVPLPALAAVTGFTTPHGAAGATWQFNPPYPSPAPMMGLPPPGNYGYTPLPPGYWYPPPQPGFRVQVQQQPELPKKREWFGRFLGRLCVAVVIDDVMNNDTQLPDGLWF